MKEYKVSTCMGKGWSELPFLTDEQGKEADNIGYTGKNFEGNKTDITTFLNSLEHGEICIACTQGDVGDFCEKFLIFRHINMKKKSKCKAKEGMKALVKLSKLARAKGITITKFTGTIN